LTTETRTPPEFVDFVRDIGVRSFDYFSRKITDERSPFHKLATYWNELEAEQKSRFFDQLISGAQTLAASAVVTRLSGRKAAAPAVKDEAKAKKEKKHASEIDDVKEKKKNKKKSAKKIDDKKAKNKDKKGKKKKSKKADKNVPAIPSAS
jgi:hypothetical protein